MEFIHRVLSANPNNKKQLVFAAGFIIIWFGIDVIQFTDMIVGKFNQPAICQLEVKNGRN